MILSSSVIIKNAFVNETKVKRTMSSDVLIRTSQCDMKWFWVDTAGDKQSSVFRSVNFHTVEVKHSLFIRLDFSQPLTRQPDPLQNFKETLSAKSEASHEEFGV